MIITYTPADGDKHEWTFVPRKLMSPEAEEIERVTKWTFYEAMDKLTSGSMLAYRAVVYIMLRRETPTFRFDDLSLCMEEIEVQYDSEEKVALRQAVEESPELDEAQRTSILKALEDDEVDVPKGELSTTSSTTTTTTPD